MNTLGERVEATRKRIGMSQADLAERAGISQTTLSDIERGRNERSRYAVNLALALGVQPRWLVYGESEPDEEPELSAQYSRLLEAAGWTTPARIAAMLTERGYPTTSQMMCNWKSRGLSCEAILKCSRIIGCDPLWLEDGSVAIDPDARPLQPTSTNTFESIATVCLTLTQDQREQVLKFAQFVAGDQP